MLRLGRLLVVVAVLGTLGAASPVHLPDTLVTEVDPETTTEYKLKAAYLLHFAKYTTWPEESFPAKDSPIVIQVVGDDPFGKTLDKTFEEKKQKGHPFVVLRSKTVPKKVDAHLVFTNESDKKFLGQLLQACGKKPILLIGDDEGYAEMGASANFFIADSRVKFDINTTSVEKSGLVISSEVLKLARIVGGKK